MSHYRLSRSAAADLERVFLEGMDRFGLAQAERYRSELIHRLETLAQFPRVSQLRADVAPPVRIQPFRAHVIVFDVDEGGVLVVRIRHGREDWMSDPVGGADMKDGDEP